MGDYDEFEDCRAIEGGSRRLFGPDDYVNPMKIAPAVRDVVSQIAVGPKSAEDLAEVLGISRNAVCKRIFRARKLGFVIKLNGIGLYWMDGNERTCKKCGKKLAKLNKGDCCYNYPNCEGP